MDGNVLIGGLFTSVGGAPLSFVARLDPFGQVDPNFNVGVGANDAVTAIAIQQDLKIVVGGTFTAGQRSDPEPAHPAESRRHR